MIRLLLVLCLAVSPAWAETKAAEASDTRVPQSRAEMSLSFVPLVKQATPAVVNIYARRVVEAQSPFRSDPLFGDFFRQLAPSRPRVQNSLGSGVVVSADGLVVTNYHVIGQADDIRVVQNDRREYSAEVLLADKEADLAVLRLDGAAGDMPFLDLRDSDGVEVGELVLAIGNPFGVGQTVSSGIVSGLARSGIATGNARGYFIQTDAPINPGNSGGALIDVDGRLIGINTSILTRSGGSNGIGFAIPASLIAEFLKQARAGADRFQRPWAGMSGQPVDSDLAEGLGMTGPGGMVITKLMDSSPFAEAGFVQGDVITEVDGQPVNTPAEMVYRMTVRGLGATSVFTRLRDGETDQVEVKLFAAPNDPPRGDRVMSERDLLPGLALARVNPQVIAELGLQLLDEGVAVTDAGPYGARIGLRRGDVILAVNGRATDDPDAVIRGLDGARSRVQIELMRAGQRNVIRFRR
ncbi:PDZ domain-containing protein [Aquicoccus sp. SCR17]|nr:PDZ domain-containing protein [Carideicomes alvinocaridis]